MSVVKKMEKEVGSSEGKSSVNTEAVEDNTFTEPIAADKSSRTDLDGTPVNIDKTLTEARCGLSKDSQIAKRVPTTQNLQPISVSSQNSKIVNLEIAKDSIKTFADKEKAAEDISDLMASDSDSSDSESTLFIDENAGENTIENNNSEGICNQENDETNKAESDGSLEESCENQIEAECKTDKSGNNQDTNDSNVSNEENDVSSECNAINKTDQENAIHEENRIASSKEFVSEEESSTAEKTLTENKLNQQNCEKDQVNNLCLTTSNEKGPGPYTCKETNTNNCDQAMTDVNYLQEKTNQGIVNETNTTKDPSKSEQNNYQENSKYIMRNASGLSVRETELEEASTIGEMCDNSKQDSDKDILGSISSNEASVNQSQEALPDTENIPSSSQIDSEPSSLPNNSASLKDKIDNDKLNNLKIKLEKFKELNRTWQKRKPENKVVSEKNSSGERANLFDSFSSRLQNPNELTGQIVKNTYETPENNSNPTDHSMNKTIEEQSISESEKRTNAINPDNILNHEGNLSEDEIDIREKPESPKHNLENPLLMLGLSSSEDHITSCKDQDNVSEDQQICINDKENSLKGAFDPIEALDVASGDHDYAVQNQDSLPGNASPFAGQSSSSEDNLPKDKGNTSVIEGITSKEQNMFNKTFPQDLSNVCSGLADTQDKEANSNSENESNSAKNKTTLQNSVRCYNQSDTCEPATGHAVQSPALGVSSLHITGMFLSKNICKTPMKDLTTDCVKTNDLDYSKHGKHLKQVCDSTQSSTPQNVENMTQVPPTISQSQNKESKDISEELMDAKEAETEKYKVFNVHKRQTDPVSVEKIAVRGIPLRKPNCNDVINTDSDCNETTPTKINWNDLGVSRCPKCGFTTSDDAMLQVHSCRKTVVVESQSINPKRQNNSLGPAESSILIQTKLSQSSENKSANDQSSVIEMPSLYPKIFTEKPCKIYTAGPNIFVCALCNFKAHKDLFMAHLVEHMFQYSYSCPTCTSNGTMHFQCKEDLCLHLKTHKDAQEKERFSLVGSHLAKEILMKVAQVGSHTVNKIYVKPKRPSPLTYSQPLPYGCFPVIATPIPVTVPTPMSSVQIQPNVGHNVKKLVPIAPKVSAMPTFEKNNFVYVGSTTSDSASMNIPSACTSTACMTGSSVTTTAATVSSLSSRNTNAGTLNMAAPNNTSSSRIDCNAPLTFKASRDCTLASPATTVDNPASNTLSVPSTVNLSAPKESSGSSSSTVSNSFCKNTLTALLMAKTPSPAVSSASTISNPASNTFTVPSVNISAPRNMSSAPDSPVSGNSDTAVSLSNSLQASSISHSDTNSIRNIGFNSQKAGNNHNLKNVDVENRSSDKNAVRKTGKLTGCMFKGKWFCTDCKFCSTNNSVFKAHVWKHFHKDNICSHKEKDKDPCPHVSSFLEMLIKTNETTTASCPNPEKITENYSEKHSQENDQTISDDDDIQIIPINTKPVECIDLTEDEVSLSFVPSTPLKPTDLVSPSLQAPSVVSPTPAASTIPVTATSLPPSLPFIPTSTANMPLVYPSSSTAPILTPIATLPPSSILNETLEKQSFSSADNTQSRNSHFYVCGFPGCRFSSAASEQFKNHILTDHRGALSFPCAHCQCLNRGEEELFRHMLTHSSAKMFLLYKCGFYKCRFGTNLLTEFKQHNEIIHKDADWFSCSSCNSKYSSVDDLLAHFHSVLLKSIQCLYCSVKSKDRRTILKHLSELHPGKPKQITVTSQLVCNTQIKDVQKGSEKNPKRSSLEIRTASPLYDSDNTSYNSTGTTLISKGPHIAEPSYSCKKCSFQTSRDHELKTHMETHKDNGCDECSKQFNTAKELTEHILSHQVSKCLTTKTQQKVHKSKEKIEEHPNGHQVLEPRLQSYSPDSTTADLISKFPCPICEMKHEKHKSLLNHITASHSEVINLTYFRCKKCTFYSTSFRCTKQHHKDKHEGKVKILRMVQSICTEQENKDTHRSDVDYFHCDLCEFSTNEREDSINHKKIHHETKGEKVSIAVDDLPDAQHPPSPAMNSPLKCPRCEYTTKVRVSLMRHLKHHKAQDTNESTQKVAIEKIQPPSEKLQNADSSLSVSSVSPPAKSNRSPKKKEKIGSPKQFYQCKVCPFKAASLPSLRSHLASHNSKTYLKCTYCNFKCSSNANMVNHHKKLHKEQSFKYKVIDSATGKDTGKGTKKRKVSQTSPDTAKRLRLISTEQSPAFECALCGFMVPSIAGLEEHFKETHDVKCFVCSLCKFQTMRLLVMEKHLSTVHDQKQMLYKMSDSDKKVDGSITKAKAESREKDLFAGTKEPEATDNKYVSEMGGIEATEGFRCGTCNRLTASISAFHLHCSSKHVGEETPNRTAVLVYKCVDCGRRFGNKNVALLHSSDCLKRAIKESKLASNKQDFVDSLKMKDTGLTVKGTKTSPEKVNIFPCSLCTLTTNLKSSLKNHYYNHFGKRPFKCGHCSYSSVRLDTAQKHNRCKHPDLECSVVKDFNPKIEKKIKKLMARVTSVHKEAKKMSPKISSGESTIQTVTDNCSSQEDDLFKDQHDSNVSEEYLEIAEDDTDGKIRAHFPLVGLYTKFRDSADQMVFRCDLCDFQCHSSALVTAHVYNNHMPKCFKCAYCEFQSYPSSAVTSHQKRIHKTQGKVKFYFSQGLAEYQKLLARCGKPPFIVETMKRKSSDMSDDEDFQPRKVKQPVKRLAVQSDSDDDMESTPVRGKKPSVRPLPPDSESENDVSESSNYDSGCKSKTLYKKAAMFCCHLCKFKSRSLKGFAEHLSLHSVFLNPSRINKSKCGFCSFTTFDAKEFNDHAANHILERPFKCSYCSYSCFSKPKMTNHLKLKHPSKAVSYAEVPKNKKRIGETVIDFNPRVIVQDIFFLPPKQFDNLAASIGLISANLQHLSHDKLLQASERYTKSL